MVLPSPATVEPDELRNRDGLDLRRDAVFMFPGQGSQVKEMRERVRSWCPELLELVQDVLGEDPFASAESTTRLLQPAVFCTSIAGWRRASVLNRRGDRVVFAGHSLGELAALVAADSIGVEDGLRLVMLRGVLMEQAAAEGAGTALADAGGMLAVLGVELAAVERIADLLGLSIAGDNAPGELVLSGDAQSLADVSRRVSQLGGKSVRLPIRGAFHSPAMERIMAPFESAVRLVAPRAPSQPVFSSITVEPFDDIPRRLAESLTSTVRWRETLLALRRAGARRVLDIGPGKVLKGLVGRTLENVQVGAVDGWDGTWLQQLSTYEEEAA